MNRNRWVAGMLCYMLVYGACFGAAAQAANTPAALPNSAQRALAYLENCMDETVGDLYVYKDFAVNENHFVAKARIGTAQQEFRVRNMDENWTENPASGSSCIRCGMQYAPETWGGWMFLNGRLEAGQTEPALVWGDVEGCTLDLSGVTSLTFMARGELGGEVVEFFLGGVGYREGVMEPNAEYPDSTPKVSTSKITLTDTWEPYTLNLAGVDLSAVGCGFGFVTSGTWCFDVAEKNNGEVTFYLDDIRYEGDVIAADTPRFIASYETDNQYIKNAAFSYDNALCAMAFTAVGDQRRAKLIVDAFVGAIRNDRYQANRVRNAYVYGDPRSFPGWGGKTRLPGFYVGEEYCEDRYQVGSNLGNTSFVVLALLKYYACYGGAEYLETAQILTDFAIANWTDSCNDGFFAGYDGWPENGTVYQFTYKSAEHNIDFYAACTAMYQITGSEVYRAAAGSALRFLDGMYDRKQGLFWTGTTGNGKTTATDNIVLDVQVWSALALGEAAALYRNSVQYAADTLQTPGGGYAFSQCDAQGAYWLEGTAFTALAFAKCGMRDEADAALAAMEAAQLPSGGFPAVADGETIDTGFALFTGEPWLYGTDVHIVPAAWYILAVLQDNPYVISVP